MIHSPSHNLLYIIGRPLTAYEDSKQLINIMFTLRKRLSRILHRWGWRGGNTEPLGGSNDHQSQIGWWRPQKKRNWDCYNSIICRWPWLTLTLTKHRLRHSWRFEEDGDDGRVRTKVQPSPTDLWRSWTCPGHVTVVRRRSPDPWFDFTPTFPLLFESCFVAVFFSVLAFDL